MDFALLFLRFLVMLVFVSSGWSHVTKSEQRAKDVGFSAGFTKFLGIIELLAGLGVGFGVLSHLSSVGLMIVLLGAMHRKALVWKTGFWGKGSQGWHYDLILFAINLLVFACNGGRWTVARYAARLTGMRWVDNL